MTAHARLFLRVSSRAVREWKLEGENEASFSPNFKPSVDGNEFYGAIAEYPAQLFTFVGLL